MFQNTKCECGHQNPVGTILCESCGKPLEDEGDGAPLEMRYDGVARRSQKVNPNVIDRVWRFFSSVRNAVTLIVITLIGSMLGTIFPQESMFDVANRASFDFAALYEENYGIAGYWYNFLGLSHTYSSWWFRSLLFLIGVSLVVCSLDRVLPLYKALTRQNVRKHHSFLLRQKLSFQGRIPANTDELSWTDKLEKALRKRKYRIYRDGTALLAEKYRFSRWGPYVLHIGLILFLIGSLMRSLPGWSMDKNVSIMEGVTEKIANTPYYIKNEKFTVEVYGESEMSEEFRRKGNVVPKQYETKAVLYTCTARCEGLGQEPELTEVARHDIRVNDPLSYQGFQAYQFDFRQTLQLQKVKPRLIVKATGETAGQFELPMQNPPDKYQAGAYKLTLLGYFPDFGLDEQKQPITKSNEPNAPAFIFQIEGPGLAPGGEPYMYFPREIDKSAFSQDKINGALASKIELSVGSMSDVQFAQFTTVLNIREDKAMPVIWTGAGIGLFGLVMGLWQHRRVWVRVDDEAIALGAYTNKNWFGFRKELTGALKATDISVDSNSLDRGGTQT